MHRLSRFHLILAVVAVSALAAWLVLVLARPEGAYAYFSYDSLDDGDLGTMDYAIYTPAGYERAGRLPLVIFLHGPWQRGGDGRLQLTEGLGPVIASRVRSGKPVEFIALFPQSYSGNWHPGSDDGRLLMKVMARVQEKYSIDPERVYLTGVSNGASAVWNLAATFPAEWAAIVPVGGAADPTIAPTIKHIPCWCFHGGADKVVAPDRTRRMISALRQAGGEPRYTEYPGREHDISIAPYSAPGLFEWLLAQRRPSGSG